MPTFNQKILDGFVETFQTQADKAIKRIEKLNGKGQIDIFDLISHYSINSVCGKSNIIIIINLEIVSTFLLTLTEIEQIKGMSISRVI